MVQMVNQASEEEWNNEGDDAQRHEHERLLEYIHSFLAYLTLGLLLLYGHCYFDKVRTEPRVSRLPESEHRDGPCAIFT